MSEEQKSAGPQEVTSVADFEAKLKDAPGKVLLDFVEEGCGACEEEAPEMAQLATDCEGKAVVIRVDVGKVPELADRFHIDDLGGTPTILYAKDAASMTPELAVEVDPAGARRRLKCARTKK